MHLSLQNAAMFQGLHTYFYISGSTHLLLFFRAYKLAAMFQGLHTYFCISGSTNLLLCSGVYTPTSIFQGLHTCFYFSGPTNLLLCSRVYTPTSVFQGLQTCCYVPGRTHRLLFFRAYTSATIFQDLHTSYISGPTHLLLRAHHGAVTARTPDLHRHDRRGVLGGRSGVVGDPLLHSSRLETHPTRNLPAKCPHRCLHLVSYDVVTGFLLLRIALLQSVRTI